MTGLREAIKKLRTRSVSNTTDYNVGFNAGLRVAAAYMEETLELDNLRKDNAYLQANPVFQRGASGISRPKISDPYRGEMPPFFPYCNDIPVAPEEE